MKFSGWLGTLADPATGFRGGQLGAGSQHRVPQNCKLHGFKPLFLGWTQIHLRKTNLGELFLGGGQKHDGPPFLGFGGMAGWPPLWIRQWLGSQYLCVLYK